MNTCGTCKYFGADRIGMRGEADRQREFGPYRVCGLVEMIDWRDFPEGASKVAFAVDGSGYYAALCVSEEFGCNQWKQK